MAGGNRQGPREMGPMTGRRQGYCAGNDQAGDEANRPVSRGRGFGRNFRPGFGRGNGKRFGNGFGGNFGGGNRHGYGRDGNGYHEEASYLEFLDSIRELTTETVQLGERITALEEQLNNKK